MAAIEGWWLLMMAIAGLLGAWLHEGAHYLVGRIWTSQQKLLRQYWLLPRRVEYTDANLSIRAIRIAGAAPLILLLPNGVLTYYLLLPLVDSGQYFFALAIGIPLFISALPISRNDRQCIFRPAEWKANP